MYRFRRTDQLLDKYGELENQEIYFSDLASLNDPLEGFKNILWKGEYILWKNLLKHYILCLHHIYFLFKVTPDDYVYKPTDISVFLSVDSLPTENMKAMIEEIYSLFFSQEIVNEYIAFLEKKSLLSPIDQVELIVHLKNIHLLALKSILEVSVKYNLEENKEIKINFPEESIKELLKNLKIHLSDNVKSIETLFRIQISLLRQVDLANAYGLSKLESSTKKFFLISSFSESYVEQLERIAYPESYVACFMPTSDNPLIWSHYGDGHKGVCLKFKINEEEKGSSIELEKVIGWGSNGAIKAFSPFYFHKIEYNNEYSNFFFFENIGGLPFPRLLSQWHKDDDNVSSFFLENLSTDDAAKNWRKKHWAQYTERFSRKLKEWDYENESRLLLTGMMGDYIKKDSRKLKYKFEILDGIIFGAKTSFSDKIKIIRIIEEKCKKYKRSDFNFFQANLKPNYGKIEIEKLTLLKF